MASLNANIFQVLFLVTFRDITAFKQPIVDDEKEVGGIGGISCILSILHFDYLNNLQIELHFVIKWLYSFICSKRQVLNPLKV